MANGASNYRFIGQKVGLPGGPTQPQLGVVQWSTSTVYALNTLVQNGGFLFKVSVAGTSAASGVGPCPLRLTDNTVTYTLQGAVGGPYLVTTTQLHELGLIEELLDSGPNAFGVGEAIYVKFTGTTNPGDFVFIDRNGITAAQVATTNRGLVGVSLGAGANGSFGWVMIRGVHDACNLGSGASAVGAQVYESATAGRLLTTASATNGVTNVLVRVTADASNVGVAECAWPGAFGNP